MKRDKAFEAKLRRLVADKKPLEFLEAVLKRLPYHDSATRGGTDIGLWFYGGRYEGKGVNLAWAQWRDGHPYPFIPACGATILDALQIANAQLLEYWEKSGFPAWNSKTKDKR